MYDKPDDHLSLLHEQAEDEDWHNWQAAYETWEMKNDDTGTA